MSTKYDSKRQRAIFFEIPLIKKDYLALKEYFGNRLEEYMLKNKTDDLLKNIIKFKDKRIAYIDFGHIPNISKFNKFVSELDGLEGVYLNNLYLSKIPNSIYNLSQIRYLELSGNNLKEISPNIKNLNNLEYLNLSNNPLLKLSKNILKLIKLKEIKLHNTNVNIDENIVKKMINKGLEVKFNI